VSEEGLDGDVFGVGGDVVVGETDGYEAGKVLEGRFEFLAERARVKLSAGCLNFVGWDVSALDGGVTPALPFVGWVIFAVAPKVVEPAGRPIRGGNKQCPALFVGQGGSNDLKPDLGVHKCGFVEHHAGQTAATEGHCVLCAL
jgi:hypothetical protein